MIHSLFGCSSGGEGPSSTGARDDGLSGVEAVSIAELPQVRPGHTAMGKSVYTDDNGEVAVIPSQFTISTKANEQAIEKGLVVIGPDGSEYVWVPTVQTDLAVRDFGPDSLMYASGFSGFQDNTDLESYQRMVQSVEHYGGFYIGRYEASFGDNGQPMSKPVTADEPGTIMVRYSPQDATAACANLYAENETVQGFFPWGITWDTTLQWIIDSNGKTAEEVIDDSTSWGNYSNNTFAPGANGAFTGQWKQTKANNIYDLAGNNWEWTQERYGSNYVIRGGGYNLMGGPAPGYLYPAVIRDPLPGNDHHPNVTFRTALYVE